MNFKLIFPKVAAAVAGALLIASSPLRAQEVVETARDLLPADVRASGTLQVAGPMIWPPYNWIDENQQYTGWEVELVRIIAAKLGLEPSFSDIKFATVIPSIESGRYDLAVGQLGITAARTEIVDFVPNSFSRLGMLVGNGHEDLDVNNLCGHELALTLGSTQTAVVDSLSQKCVAEGKPAIEINEFPDTANSYLAVANGRAEGFILTGAVAAHIASQNPALAASPTRVEGYESVSGLMISKGRPEFRAALVAAFESAMEDGSYVAVLEKYGVSDIAVDEATLNTPLGELAQ